VNAQRLCGDPVQHIWKVFLAEDGVLARRGAASMQLIDLRPAPTMSASLRGADGDGDRQSDAVRLR
jgi:hypothetical protein